LQFIVEFALVSKLRLGKRVRGEVSVVVKELRLKDKEKDKDLWSKDKDKDL